MSFAESIKGLIFKKPKDQVYSISHPDLILPNGQIKGQTENPYLNARRTSNENTNSLISSRQTWQIIGILGLLIALAAVGGITHIGSQSKIVPYVIWVDKHNEVSAVEPVHKAGKVDQRVVHAAVASFISDARLVTPDVALQRKAVFKLYSMLSSNDPATTKTNEWLNGTADSSPFKRAAKETVSTEIISVIPQTPDTWQVDWMETIRDRQGISKGQPFRMRALVTVYTAAPNSNTTEAQVRNNPLGIYVLDYSWSKQL